MANGALHWDRELQPYKPDTKGILHAWWNAPTELLTIQWSNGSYYAFENFTLEMWKAWMKAGGSAHYWTQAWWHYYEQNQNMWPYSHYPTEWTHML